MPCWNTAPPGGVDTSTAELVTHAYMNAWESPEPQARTRSIQLCSTGHTAKVASARSYSNG